MDIIRNGEDGNIYQKEKYKTNVLPKHLLNFVELITGLEEGLGLTPLTRMERLSLMRTYCQLVLRTASRYCVSFYIILLLLYENIYFFLLLLFIIQQL